MIKSLFVIMLILILGAQAAETVDYCGTLPSEADTAITLTFNLYSSEDDAEPVAVETRTVDVESGAFEVALSSGDLAEDSDYFVEVLDGGEVVIPREPLMRPTEPMATCLEIGDGTNDIIMANPNGNVGIGTNPATTAKVDVSYTAGVVTSPTYGVRSQISQNDVDQSTYAGYFKSTLDYELLADEQAIYGVYAEGYSDEVGIGTIYGIYAKASGGATNYAGYFNGNVRIEGNFVDSDGDAGSTGQMLSSTTTGTNWITPSYGSIGGSGVANYIPMWTSADALSISDIYQAGTGGGAVFSDDFEGAFPGVEWINDGFILSSVYSHSTSHSCNGNTGGATPVTHTVSVAKTLTSDGTVSFWYRCTAGRFSDDYSNGEFRFKIDGSTVFQTNITHSTWTEFNWPVSSGSHTFQWYVHSFGGARARPTEPTEPMLPNYSYMHLYFDDVEITSGGTINVGIGTTSPSAKLHVNGSVRLQGISSSTQSNILTVDGSGNVYTRATGSWTGGDNLGNHSAIQNLDMNNFDIIDFDDLTSRVDATQPRIILDSRGDGDNWTSQGAYISLGESGDGGDAATHLTYVGDGYGYVGTGSLASGVPTGGSYFRFHYGSTSIYTNSNITLTSNKTVDGYDLSDYGPYWVNSTGTSGQVWKSDGSGRGVWGADNNSGGDITGIIAGNGLTDGGTSGTPTIHVGPGYDTDVRADNVDIEPTLDYVDRINFGHGDYGLRFDSDDTRIYANTSTSEDLMLEADGDIYISPDDDVRIDGSTIFVDGSANRVGIGTTSPGYKLDVSGSIRATSQLVSTVATGTAPLAVSSNTVVSNLNADLLDGLHSSAFLKTEGFYYYNTDVSHVEGASPQYWILCRNAASNDVNGRLIIDRTSGNYQAAILDIVVTSTTSAMQGGGLTTNQSTQSSETYRLVTLTLTSDGNSYVAIEYAGNTYPKTISRFTGHIRNSGGNTFIAVAASDVSGVTALSTTNSKHTFTGNVGIGTTSPTQKLDVNGNVTANRYYDRNSTTYYLDPASTSILSRVYAYNDLYVGSSASDDGSDLWIADVIYDWDNSAYYLDPASTSNIYRATFNGITLGGVLRTSWPTGFPSNGLTGSGNANYVSKWTGTYSQGNSSIYDNGNVGIGTASPGYKLDVNGSVHIPSGSYYSFVNNQWFIGKDYKTDTGAWYVTGEALQLGTYYSSNAGFQVIDGYDDHNVVFEVAQGGNVGVHGNLRISGGIHDGANFGSSGQFLATNGSSDIYWTNNIPSGDNDYIWNRATSSSQQSASMNISGDARADNFLVDVAAPLNNAALTINDVDRYVWTPANGWGTYWNTATNDIEYYGGGTERGYFSLDEGNMQMDGDLTVSGGNLYIGNDAEWRDGGTNQIYTPDGLNVDGYTYLDGARCDGALDMSDNSVGYVTYLNISDGTDYGIEFWNSDANYSIKMGSNQQDYGWVTDYSMHFNMGTTDNRGFTWGYSRTNVVTSLECETGHFRTRGVLYAENYINTNTDYRIDGGVVINSSKQLSGSLLTYCDGRYASASSASKWTDHGTYLSPANNEDVHLDDTGNDALFFENGSYDAHMGTSGFDFHMYMYDDWNVKINTGNSAGEYWVYDSYNNDRIQRLDENGQHYIDGGYHSYGADIAERFDYTGEIEKGDIVAVDPNYPEKLILCDDPDMTVAGIVSTEPGVYLGWGEDTTLEKMQLEANEMEKQGVEEVIIEAYEKRIEEYEQKQLNDALMLTLAGRVPCKVDASYSSVKIGDMLTISETPGHARVLKENESGQLVGIAMENLESGTGKITVLVKDGYYSAPIESQTQEYMGTLIQRIEALEKQISEMQR